MTGKRIAPKYTKNTNTDRTFLSCLLVPFVVSAFEKKGTTKYTKYTKEFRTSFSCTFAPFMVPPSTVWGIPA